ncbi:TonB family protein [Hymenobacter sp. NBH84]|nr:TonB family protein [Hymenobacter sp. NBH84]
MSAADLPRISYANPTEGHLPLPLLQQYAAGTLSTTEQHRVEAHTLICSRCADILDGLMLSDADTTDHAIAGLRERLQARVGQPEAATRTVWPWRPMAAAAALVLMLSSALWIGTRQRQLEVTSAPAIAKIRPIVPKLTLPAAAATEQAVASVSAVAPKQVKQVRAPRPAAQMTANRRKVALTNSRVTDGDETLAMLSAASSSKPAAASDVPTLARSDAGLSDTAQQLLPQSDSAVEATRLIRGRITNTQGQPLPGATVQASGAAASTATAADGTFSLRVPKPVAQVQVSSRGFLARQQPLKQDTVVQLTLALMPDSQQLNEVVMVRREKAPAPVAVDALPAGGYPAFKQYLKDSLDYPMKALENRKEGTVQLSFTVATDGTVQDVKVLRRVSEEIDTEAMRLLREGPKWFPAIRNGRRVAHPVRISIPFRLEEH